MRAAFDAMLREASHIDILVNSVWGGYEHMIENGAFTWPKPFWEQPLWRWDAMFAAGVRAHYQATQLAAPSMIARRRGLIVNISHRQHRSASAMSPSASMALRTLTVPFPVR